MSETRKSRQIPDNVINYTVQGVNEELKIEDAKGNSQKANVNNIPGIPMVIETYSNKVTNELGEPVSRVDENGNKIPVEAKYTTVGKELEKRDKEMDSKDR